MRLAAVILIVATSCLPESGDQGDETLEPLRSDREQAACLASGGRWSRIGSTVFTCVRQTRDGGQTCQTATDCEGLCLARSRTCAPIAPLFGCNEILTENGLRVTLCRE